MPSGLKQQALCNKWSWEKESEMKVKSIYREKSICDLEKKRLAE